MNNKFLTIKEASNLSGRSEITIRRVIKYLIAQKDMLPTQRITAKFKVDKQLIDQLIKQEKQNELPHSPFIYKISEDLIKQIFKITTPLTTQPTEVIIHTEQDDYSSEDDKPAQEPKQATTQNGLLVEILAEQVRIKDEQIKGLSKTIDQLIERDRETNILIGRLQAVLKLEEPKKNDAQNP